MRKKNNLFTVYGRSQKTDKWHRLNKVKYNNEDEAQEAIVNLIDDLGTEVAKKYNLYKTKRVGHVTQEIEDKIIKEYQNGLAIKVLNKRYSLTYPVIKAILVDNNIEIRHGSKSRMSDP